MDAMLKDPFIDTIEESIIDIGSLEQLQDIEAKLYTLKRTKDVKIFREGENFRIRGPKWVVRRVREFLLSPLPRSANILIRGIENSEDVLFLLTGGTWGVSDDAENVIQLGKIKNAFPIGFFCMFVSKHKDEIIDKLLNFNCELKVQGYSQSYIIVIMKGPIDYVENIFGFLTKEYKDFGITLRVLFRAMEVENKSAFLDALGEKIDTLMMTFQGSSLDLVLSETEMKTKEQLHKVLTDTAEEVKDSRCYSGVRNLLFILFSSECPPKAKSREETTKEDNRRAGNKDTELNISKTEGDEVLISENPAVGPQTSTVTGCHGITKCRIVELDSDFVHYLEQCLWEDVLDQTSEYGIKASIVQDKLTLSPISYDFEEDCDKLENKLKDALSKIKSVSIDVSQVPFNTVSMKMDQLQEEAKMCKVFVKLEGEENIVAKGKEDSVNAFVKITEKLLGIPVESSSVNPNPKLPADESSDTEIWERIDGTSVDTQRQDQNSGHPQHAEAHSACTRSLSYPGVQSSHQLPEGEKNGSLLRDVTSYRHCDSGIVIYCAVADITKLEVDCIVNAANRDLEHYGGVAYAIAKAAGEQLKKESRDYILSHGPLDIAGVCITSAGNMPCQKVLHTVGPLWSEHGNREESVDQLQQAFMNCLQKAEQLQMTSIAFPAISAGVFGMPITYVSRAAAEAICAFCVCNQDGRSFLQKIYLVDLSSATLHSFNAIFSDLANRGALEMLHPL